MSNGVIRDSRAVHEDSQPYLVEMSAVFVFGKQEAPSTGSWTKCKVSYSLEALMRRPGILNFNVESRLPLEVLAKGKGLFAPQMTVGPETRPVTTYCCLNGGGRWG